MKEPLNAWAKKVATGEIIHVNNAERGDACNCICIVCGSALQARKGEERQPHFKHISGKECNPESILHKLIKEIFTRHDRFMLPDGKGYFTYQSCSLEKPLGKLRPDIILHGEVDVHIEVAVTSFIKETKFKIIAAAGLRTIEIDAGGISGYENLESLEKMIIHEQHNKKVIFWPEEFAVSVQSDDSGSFWGFVFLALVFLAGILFLSKRSRLKKMRSTRYRHYSSVFPKKYRRAPYSHT